MTRHGTEVRFLPGAAHVRRMLALFILGGILMLVGGLVLAHLATFHSQFFTVSGFVVALLLWCVAVWTWLGRSTALVIDTSTGEVRFGNRVLCEAGTVQAVVVRQSDLDVEEGACGFEFLVRDGGVRAIPSPLFTAMAVETAGEFAAAVAAVLKVKVTEPGHI